MDNVQNNQQFSSPTPFVAVACILLFMRLFMIVAPGSIGIATVHFQAWRQAAAPPKGCAAQNNAKAVLPRMSKSGYLAS